VPKRLKHHVKEATQVLVATNSTTTQPSFWWYCMRCEQYYVEPSGGSNHSPLLCAVREACKRENG
jgi:hypothetical protein